MKKPTENVGNDTDSIQQEAIMRLLSLEEFERECPIAFKAMLSHPEDARYSIVQRTFDREKHRLQAFIANGNLFVFQRLGDGKDGPRSFIPKMGELSYWVCNCEVGCTTVDCSNSIWDTILTSGDEDAEGEDAGPGEYE